MKRKSELPTAKENKPKKIMSTSPKAEFTDFYEKNINWMDEFSDESVLDQLKLFYGDYFIEDEPNYEKMVIDISAQLKVRKEKPAQKAGELFRALFKMPYKTSKLVITDDLIQIENEFGSKIMAHGVEEAKGGMYNLLLMSISNQVWAPSMYWGLFISGLPNISPVGHGPYYLIYNLPSSNNSLIPPNNPKLTEIARILVPFKENQDILIEKLDQMVQVNLITLEMKKSFIQKLITYKEFLGELRASNVMKKESAVSSTGGPVFFGVTSTSTSQKRDEEVNLNKVGVITMI